jgi:hypothetical protein
VYARCARGLRETYARLSTVRLLALGAGDSPFLRVNRALRSSRPKRFFREFVGLYCQKAIPNSSLLFQVKSLQRGEVTVSQTSPTHLPRRPCLSRFISTCQSALSGRSRASSKASTMRARRRMDPPRQRSAIKSISIVSKGAIHAPRTRSPRLEPEPPPPFEPAPPSNPAAATRNAGA